MSESTGVLSRMVSLPQESMRSCMFSIIIPSGKVLSLGHYRVPSVQYQIIFFKMLCPE